MTTIGGDARYSVTSAAFDEMGPRGLKSHNHRGGNAWNMSMGTSDRGSVGGHTGLACISGDSGSSTGKRKRWRGALTGMKPLAMKLLLKSVMREKRNIAFYSGFTCKLDTLANSCLYHLRSFNNKAMVTANNNHL